MEDAPVRLEDGFWRGSGRSSESLEATRKGKRAAEQDCSRYVFLSFLLLVVMPGATSSSRYAVIFKDLIT